MFFATSMRQMLSVTPTRQMFAATPMRPMFAATPVRNFAHWYSNRSTKVRFRYAREKRYHPNSQIARNSIGKNGRSKHFKTNKWNYKQAYKDM